MEDGNLRLELHRALDPITPPAPWLSRRLRDEMQRRRRETLVERVRRRPAEFAWLMPAVAVILALAIILSALVSHRLTLPVPVPVFPHGAAAVGCPTWGYVPGGTAAPATIKMMSTTVGWAPGDLRTTDGGADWHDVSPKGLRAGAPYLPGQQTVYPPNYSDFFLDANHAWLVRSYDSDQRCLDHFDVFRTSDGGQTWRSGRIQADGITARPQPALDFIDPQHGWLLLALPPTQATKTAPSRPRSVVFSTADGGETWRRISTAGPQCPNLVFASVSRGYSGCGSQFSGGDLLATTDGGVTWHVAPILCQCSVAPPVFFDSSHGATLAYTGDGGEVVYITADAGVSWQKTASAQPGSTVWFEDQHDFWLFTTQPTFSKGGVATDWLYHSSDAGATWQLVQRDTPVGGASSVSFVDPSHGFVAQENTNFQPQILVTNDGGHTWQAMEVHVS